VTPDDPPQLRLPRRLSAPAKIHVKHATARKSRLSRAVWLLVMIGIFLVRNVTHLWLWLPVHLVIKVFHPVLRGLDLLK
jgi:hypothetical protein